MMKKFLLLIIILISLYSCFSEQKEGIIGDWYFTKKEEDGSITSEYYTFNKDNTFKWEEILEDKNGKTVLDSFSGKYFLDIFYESSIAYPKITFEYEKDGKITKTTILYLIKNDTLKIGTEGNNVLYFKVKKGATNE